MAIWNLCMDEVHHYEAESEEQALQKFKGFLEYLLKLPLTGGTTEKPSLNDYVSTWMDPPPPEGAGVVISGEGGEVKT